MRKSILLLLIAWAVCFHGSAQMNRDSTRAEGFFAGTRLTIETGLFFPVGNLSSRLSGNPMFGLSIDIPTDREKQLVGLDFILFSTRGSHPFPYKLPDSLASTQIIKAGFLGGIHYTHRSFIRDRYILDQILGIGLGALYTNLEKKNPANENDRYYTVNSMEFRLGLHLKRAMSAQTRLGLKLMYHYSPFHLFNQSLPDRFGGSSVSVAAGFTF